jgi:hypothetical protein
MDAAPHALVSKIKSQCVRHIKGGSMVGISTRLGLLVAIFFSTLICKRLQGSALQYLVILFL